MPATKKLVCNIRREPASSWRVSVRIQVIPLYVLASVVALVCACRNYLRLDDIFLMLVAAFGDAVIYLMINPTKASYSMAPTMMVCALAVF